MMLLGFDDRSMDHSCSSLCLLVLGEHFPSSCFLGAGDSSNILALGSLLEMTLHFYKFEALMGGVLTSGYFSCCPRAEKKVYL